MCDHYWIQRVWASRTRGKLKRRNSLLLHLTFPSDVSLGFGNLLHGEACTLEYAGRWIFFLRKILPKTFTLSNLLLLDTATATATHGRITHFPLRGFFLPYLDRNIACLSALFVSHYTLYACQTASMFGKRIGGGAGSATTLAAGMTSSFRGKEEVL